MVDHVLPIGGNNGPLSMEDGQTDGEEDRKIGSNSRWPLNAVQEARGREDKGGLPSWLRALSAKWESPWVRGIWGTKTCRV